MMFVQYIDEKMLPNFDFSKQKIKPVKFKFDSLSEFLSHEFIRYFTRGKNFDSFVIRTGCEYDYVLLVKLKTGQHCEIGFLGGDIRQIPEWCGQKIMIATNKGLIL